MHLLCVLMSLGGFFARGVGHLCEAHWVNERWVKVLPHVVDSLLLLSGISLIIITRQYPGETLWISVKLGLVVAYILLGIIAFRLARTRLQRLSAWGMALMVVGLILFVATSR